MERKRAKILVIDDTKTNIEVLEGILSGEYDVFVALEKKKGLFLTEKSIKLKKYTFQLPSLCGIIFRIQ